MNRLQNEECGKKNFKNLYFTNEIEKPLKKVGKTSHVRGQEY